MLTKRERLTSKNPRPAHPKNTHHRSENDADAEQTKLYTNSVTVTSDTANTKITIDNMHVFRPEKYSILSKRKHQF